MPTATVNGVALNYLEHGRGPAVVLIHGFPLDARIWTAQLDALANDFRILALNLPGFGKSASGGTFTIESLARTIHAFIEQVNASPAVLGGLSMGGYTALAYARLYPTVLRGLMLVDTRAEADSAEGRANRDKMIDLVRQHGAKPIADQMLPRLLNEDAQRTRPLLVRQVRRIMEACPPLTIEHALTAMRDRADESSFLDSIAIPTLIICGEHDAITPPSVAQAMQRRIPDASLALIKGAGHLAPMEQGELVNGAMRKFLSGLR